jgi:hypothetical protein
MHDGSHGEGRINDEVVRQEAVVDNIAVREEACDPPVAQDHVVVLAVRAHPFDSFG